MTLADDVDLEEFITAKDDLSGADIKAVCTEAGLLALRERRMRVTKADVSAAREKVRSLWFRCSLQVDDCPRSYTGRMRASRKAYICNLPLFLTSVFLCSRSDGGRINRDNSGM
jgi:hypothetical protein